MILLSKYNKLFLIVFFIFLISIKPIYAFPAFLPDQGVYIYEINSGDVVYAQNENIPFSPASTTKLMTSLVLFDYVTDFDQIVTVGEEVNDYGWADSRAGLWLGQQLSYTDLLYALLLPSGNDAAGTIAVNVGKIILDNPNATKDEATQAFVAAMNNKAKELGLTQTNFVNPSGITTENHYTTPSDMAKIATEAFSNETIKIVSEALNYQLINSSGQPYFINNTNTILYPTNMVSENVTDAEGKTVATQKEVASPLYSQLLTAGKTGTNIDGTRTFVFLSEQGDADIIGVIFNYPSKDIFTQAKQTIDELNSAYFLSSLTGNNDCYVNTALVDNTHFSDGDTLTVTSDYPIYFYNMTGSDNYTSEIRWDSRYISDDNVNLELINSINEGSKVGALLIYNEDGSVVKTIPLYATNQLSVKNFTDFFIDNIFIITLSLFILITLLLITSVRKSGQQQIINKRY